VSTPVEQYYDAVYQSPVGEWGIRLQDQQLKQLVWLSSVTGIVQKESSLLRTILDALHNYFTNAQPFPVLPLAPDASVFQRRVWTALLDIPFGQVITYGQLARQLNTSSRAIGQACRSNPIPVVIPCHRVVAASGLGGYMGETGNIKIKQWLLAHEGYG
jgi:methylated-DNA-[protein]-cysteine S-methyltransferase